ncbi:MAG: CHAT domain-containing protein [Aureispira sp.]|nr:CHAT domain-containing protein [Aureispira sp.]
MFNYSNYRMYFLGLVLLCYFPIDAQDVYPKALDAIKMLELEQAKQYMPTAIEELEKSEDWAKLVDLYKKMASLYGYNKDYQGMKTVLVAAQKLIKQHLENSCKYKRTTYLLYGEACYYHGDYHRAEGVLEEGLDCALSELKSREDTIIVADYYYNLGIVHAAKNNVDKALDYSLAALSHHEKLGNQQAISDIYHNLGFLYYGNKDYKKALKYILIGRDVRLNIEEGRDVYYINCNVQVAKTYRELGLIDSAFTYLSKNIDAHKTNQHKEPETYEGLAQLHLERGEFDEAEMYAERALTIRKSIYGEMHPLIAKTYALLAEINAAQGELKTGLDKIQAGIHVLDETYPIENLAAIPNSMKVLDNNILLTLITLKAKLHLQDKDIPKSYPQLEYALEIVDLLYNEFSEDGAKLQLFKTAIPVYEQTLQLALEQYEHSNQQEYLDQAFQLVEKSKALLLLEALKSDEVRSFGSVPDSLLQQEYQLNKELAQNKKKLFEVSKKREQSIVDSLQNNILQLERERTKLKTVFKEHYQQYFKLKYNEQQLSLTQIQEQLDESTMVIEYFWGDEALYVFSVCKTGMKYHIYKDVKALQGNVDNLRLALTDVNLILKASDVAYNLFTSNAHFLYTNLIEPVLVEGMDRLVIVPDGNLSHIPFEVLLATQAPILTDDKPNYAELDYLIKGHNIHYHYSTALLLRKWQRSKNKSKILAMASSYTVNEAELENIESDRELFIRSNLKDLPGAVAEVDMLQSTFYGDFLRAKESNETGFKDLASQNDYSVLHLAMHGVVDTKNPLYSSLIFTKTAENTEVDDILYAYELNLLQLKADLVVLSACETGYGKYERGEGVLSLGRGFMYAGIPSIAMTLWPLNDQASARLMTDFYNNLCADLSIDEAMQKAKIDYINGTKGRSAHPYFWASFITLGDYMPIEIARQGFWVNYGWYVGAAVLALLILIVGILKRKK